MSGDVIRLQWFRNASAKNGRIFSRCWMGETVKAVVEIAHGMSEHSGRYEDFAVFLAKNGFAVYMNDHAGHGMSSQPQGYFADENGWAYVVEDLKALQDEAKKRFEGLPLFLMGHSMGSFLSRSFLARFGQGLSGCILCGTMGKNPGVGLGKALASLQCRIMGPRAKGNLINRLSMGGYNRGIKHPVNVFAWLSANEENCRAYAADRMCGFEFTAAGYRDLFTGLLEISTPQWARQVPKEVPVYLLAGDRDPVGNYGKGPVQVADALKDAGVKDVQIKLYPGMRHEILNETGKEEVWKDILAWLNEHIDGPEKSAV